MKKLSEYRFRSSQDAIAVAGICYDKQSSFMPGTSRAPNKIREAFYSDSTNQCCENGLDLAEVSYFLDAGDIHPADGTDWLEGVQAFATGLLEQGLKTVFLGGDHSISFPLLRAHAKKYDNIILLHLDAHADLYDSFEGSRYSNACPFARIMEENLARKLIQAGIRTLTPHQREQAARWNVDILEMKDRDAFQPPDTEAPVYVSLDMDVLDPVFAPGVSHPEPGGLSTRELLDIIQSINAPIVGADIVEYNPLRDPTGITARVAVKLLKELVAKMIEFK